MGAVYPSPIIPTQPSQGATDADGGSSADIDAAPRSHIPRRDWLLGGLVVVALLAILAGTAVWRIARSEETALEAPPATTAPVAPDDEGDDPEVWPLEIQPLAEFVEQHRGGPFDHPIPIEYLEEADYEAAVTESSGLETDEDRAELEEWAAQMRSLGLLAPGVDVEAALNQLYGEGTLAFYDEDAEVIKVLGSNFDIAHQVTLVHELTHAWQDQHGFIPDLDELDDTAASTVQGLLEGDANRIEAIFVDSLSSKERRQYDEQSQDQGEEVDLSGVPGVLVSGLGSPYALGEPFVAILDEQGGNGEVDAALADPPPADADLLEPQRYIDGITPLEVAEPATPAGAERIDGGDFGALSWLMVLGERIDPRDALAVTDTWAGDQYVAYRLDGRVCTAIAFRAETPADTGVAADRMNQWGSASVGLDATVEIVADDVVLRSCDPVPGSPASQPADRTELSLAYAALRVQIFSEAIGEDFSIDESRCIGDHFARAITPEQMQDGAANDPSVGQRLGPQAVDACT